MKQSAALCLLLSGCVSAVAPQTVSIPFNPAEVAWFDGPGDNSIHGSAVLRTVGGDAKTCAGLDANIVPDSAYARARFLLMYRRLDRGLLAADSGFKFASTDPRYETSSRTTRCDPQGFFVFDHLPDGTYFVTAKVVWGVPQPYFTSWQGGYLMQRVTIAGGTAKSIVLADD